MSDRIEFLEARIAEDEEYAREATQGNWKLLAGDAGEYDGILSDLEKSDRWHAERWDPPRVLAECAAKRELLQLARHIKDNTWQDGQLKVVSEFRAQQILRALLLPYTSHPDYDPTWKD